MESTCLIEAKISQGWQHDIPLMTRFDDFIDKLVDSFQKWGNISSHFIMVAMAKWLTHRIVIPTYVGSIPTSHPTYSSKNSDKYLYMAREEIVFCVLIQKK